MSVILRRTRALAQDALFRVLICTAILELTAYAQVVPPKQLKRNAIVTLQGISTSDAELQKKINAAAADISQSLSDKDTDFFLDDWRILPPPKGLTVFDQELNAANELAALLKEGKTAPNIRSIVPDILDALVQADREIAERSLVTAERFVQVGEGDARIVARARQQFDQAAKETDPTKAIEGFKNAWQSSQDVANQGGLVITSFNDGPDLFSARVTSNKLTATLQSFKTEGDSRQSIEFIEIIQDASTGATIRNITTTHDVPVVPKDDHAWSVTLTSSWDGKDNSGQTAKDGLYNYVAFGRIVNADDAGRAGTKGDNNNNHSVAVVFPISGSVTLDSTPPNVTAVRDKPPNAAGWNNTNVTVSFVCSDGTGVATCPTPVTVASEGANLPVTGMAVDIAGNTAAVAVILNIDKTPPLIAAVQAPSPNARGWNNSDVTVSFGASDALSGLANVTAPTIVRSEGSNQRITGTAVDLAGNVATAIATVSLDKTPPTLTFGSAVPSPNKEGWNNSDVRFSFSTADNLSGVAATSVPNPLTLNSEGAAVSGAVTVTDVAGNSATFTSAAVKIDKTPPTLTFAVAVPPPNAAGWNNTNVSFAFTTTDSLSGVASTSIPSPLLLTTEGTAVNGNVVVTDIAGNTATFTSRSVKIEKTPPTAQASASPQANAAGWNNTDVTISFAGSNSLSGIVSCSQVVTLNSEETNQSASGTCADNAGNVSSPARVSGINIDKTPPTLAFGVANPAPNAAGWNNSDVSFSFTTADNLSGVASTSVPSPLTLTTEGASINGTITITDVAGNSATFTSPSVKIDKTPPMITISSPAEGATLFTPSATISGRVTDPLSGIAAASCNGAVVTVSQDSLNCAVSLVPQANSFVVQATDVAGNSQTSTTHITYIPVPTITSIDRITGQQGQTITVTLTGTNFVSGITQASFGDGVAVGGATAGGFGPISVSSATTATAQIVISATATLGLRTVTVQNGTQRAALTDAFTVIPSGPVITDFNPKSGPSGTLVTVSGTNFIPSAGAVPQVALAQQGGGNITVPLSSFTNTAVTFVIPSGAATGPVSITSNGQTATSGTALAIVASSNFTLTAAPAGVTLVQGQSAAAAVQLTTASGFSSLAELTLAGLPAGLTATFQPPKITAGQTSILTLSAPASQGVGPATLTITASSIVDGVALSQSATVQLSVQSPTTSFIGRTVLSDVFETPLAGVTITMLGKDGNGNTTGCTGNTQSDAAGNFALTNLAGNCVGPQLVGFDGTTVSSPPGTYAGVNLVFTLASGQVTPSPIPVHLPRIDNLETFYVQQNAGADQSYSYQSIPGLSLTIYAHTTFTMPDGSQPNPFPLVAANVPVDRLPDAKPSVPTMMRVFIVAFQPANVNASQPVAVSYPNIINTPPGSNMSLMTLDPTRGQMVPYGTATVSADGTQTIPDLDPSHPGHRFGIVHFDWHGNMPAPPAQPNPGPPGGGGGGGNGPSAGPGPGPGGSSGPGGGPNPPGPPLPPGPPPSPCNSCPCGASEQNPFNFLNTDAPAQSGDPVDLFSGAQVISNTDISINGSRGSIAVTRTYRSLTTAPGPFGVGTNHNYNYGLDTAFPGSVAVINLIMPDGNRFPFPAVEARTFKNSTIPFLQGAFLFVNPDNSTDLRWKNGTVWHFSPISFALGSLLTSIRDPNGNTITIARDSAGKVTTVSDPVGRSLTFAYDGANRITSITDPTGRSVRYTYNSQGTLATATDPAGGVTSYTYDGRNNMISVSDPRGIMQAQNTLDATGRVVQQTRPDGGVLSFAYTPMNPTSPVSQMLLTQVGDSQGVRAAYRFNVNGFVTDVAGTNGETRHLERTAGTNLLASATESSATASYNYDANGNVLSNTDATGRTTRFTYDPLFNQVTSVTDPAGNVTRFAYDTHGNLISQTDANGNVTSYQYDSTGLLTQTTDALGQKTTFSYDNFGNLIAVMDALGNKTTSAYDPLSRLIQTTDALGRATSFAYDALGRLTSRTDAKGGATRSTYDADGNLLSVTDANGNKTAFAYDSMNRLVSRTDALGKTDTRTYDTNGNLIKFVDRRGQTSSFTNDNLNRTVTETYQDSTVTHSYDALGRLVQVNDSAAGTFTYSYDPAGRLLASTTPYGTVNYTYDARGAVASRQVVGQPALTYTYDPAGNLTSSVMPQASESFTYNPRNQTATITRQNGVATTYAYDPIGRLLSLNHSKGTTNIDSETYAYDAIGNRTSHATSLGQSLVTQPTTNEFDVGNRLIQFGSTSERYDANGNLTQDATATYTWDSRNRLKSIVTTAGQTTAFTYDAADNLIAQSDTGPTLNLTKYFVLDSETNVAYEAASDGTSYSVLSGLGIDSHLGIVQSNGQVQYGLPDAINSTIATVDQAGALKSQFAYDSFGQTRTSGNYPFEFTGRVPVTADLYYYRARFYNPTTGRFVAADPIGFAGGDSNLYRYASNSPALLTDPAGLMAYVCSKNSGTYHEWVCVYKNNKMTCYGFCPGGGNDIFLPHPGRDCADQYSAQHCTPVPDENEDCLLDPSNNKIPSFYSLPLSNCRTYANSLLNRCRSGPPITPYTGPFIPGSGTTYRNP
jgi:RHS repeat-associated protein